MPRYITPGKIGYLMLINIYCDSIVDQSATIPLLSFILTAFFNTSIEDVSVADTPRSFTSATDFDLKPLSIDLRHYGISIFDLFILRLWELDSVDALHGFFRDSELLFELPAQRRAARANEGQRTSPQEHREVILEPHTPIGAFVQRATLEFAKHQFSDLLRLWKAFELFRAPSLERRRELMKIREGPTMLGEMDNAQTMARTERQVSKTDELPSKRREKDGNGKDENEIDDGIGDVEGWMFSDADIDRLLEFQTDKMQSVGIRVLPELRMRLDQMLSRTPRVPTNLYFMRFFDAWRAGDYRSALDNLHRYFDNILHTSKRPMYHFALLHMSILHADFGCYYEAVAAMTEAIVTARESNDVVCLNYCLNWLNHLSQLCPEVMKKAGASNFLGMERDNLIFLKSNTRELRMWPLLSATLLSEARLDLIQGNNFPRVFENLYQSSHLIVQKGMWKQISGQLASQSAVYARLGQGSLMTCYMDCLAYCFDGSLSMAEIARGRLRKSYGLAASGNYDQSISLLKQDLPVSTPAILQLSQHRDVWVRLMQLTKLIRMGEHKQAQEVISQLESAQPIGPEASTELSYLTLRFLMESRQLSAAYDLVNSMLAELDRDSTDDDNFTKKNTDVAHRTQLLVLKARIFGLSGRPEAGFSIALRAADFAQKMGIMPFLWAAVAELCAALNGAEEFGGVIQIMEAAIPQAHQTEDNELLARLYDIQADAWVGLYLSETPDPFVANDRTYRSSQRFRKPVKKRKLRKGDKVEFSEDPYLDWAMRCLKRVEGYLKPLDHRSAIREVTQKIALLTQLEADRSGMDTTVG